MSNNNYFIGSTDTNDGDALERMQRDGGLASVESGHEYQEDNREDYELDLEEERSEGFVQDDRVAVDIYGEIRLLDVEDELDELIDSHAPHTVLGRVCTDYCDTNCIYYAQGTCPCQILKDVDGNIIHVFPNNV